MPITKAQKIDIINKCKKSFTFFCENFCKVKHPSAGIIPFKLFEYQKKSVKIFKEKDRVIYRKCRQSGISTLTGAYALWSGMFFPNKQILIVSKRDEDAIAYLSRNVKFVYEHLPELFYEAFGDPRSASSRKHKPLLQNNDHTIGFFHGSSIKSLTSSKDTLRSNAASLVIIDEAAFINEMDNMWCVSEDTLISTEDGLIEIKDILDQKSKNPEEKECFNHNLLVDSDEGLVKSDKVCYNGYSDTIKIKTKFGYEIEATPKHRFRISDDYTWKRLSDIKIGDGIALKCGGTHNKINLIDKNLAESIGRSNIDVVPKEIFRSTADVKRSFIMR
jgi:hypothetical protein